MLTEHHAATPAAPRPQVWVLDAAGRPRTAWHPPLPAADPLPPTHARLRRIFREAGLPASLAHLNQRTQQRITAVLGGSGAGRWCEAIHDRAPLDALPGLLVAGCDAVERWRCPVVTVHAAGNFCGHPLLGRDGSVVGVVCHVDPVARGVPREELGLLRELATLLESTVRGRRA